MLPSRPSSPLCSPSRRGRLLLAGLVALSALPFAPGEAAADAPMPLCPSGIQAAAAPSVPRETKPDANAKLDISSDHATLGVDGDVTLHGHVKVRQGDREVTAENAQYDRATGALAVQGEVVYQDPLVRLTGSDGRYSPSGGADVKSAQFELLQRSARGSARSLDLTPEGILDLRGVTFTTCPRGDEAWQLHAGSLTLDTAREVGTGRGASIDFKGVPILYLPWFSFPIGGERKTGFLFPSIGNSSLSGFELQVPYYWNIAPNADLTFSPMLYTRRGVDLAGDARLLTAEQEGELTWHYLPDDRLAGHGIDALAASDRSYVRLRDLVSLPRDVRITVDAANVSDADYFQDFGNGPEATSTAFVERLGLASYRDEFWNLGAEAQQYQTIDVQLPDVYRPYARAPRLYADGDFGWGSTGLFRYGFDSELVNFTRAVGVMGWRLDAAPRVGLDYEHPGYFVRSSLEWRYTRYALDGTPAGEQRSPSRSLPIASFETGLSFEGSAGGSRTLTLEPRVLYVYIPYRNQDALPIFDTALPDLNLVELFRTNRYVGADRVSDADQVTAALTSRLLNADTGQQYLSATLGQTYHFEAPRVHLPGERVDGRRESDLAGELVVSAFQNWNVDLNLEWNPAESRADRTFVQLQFEPGAERVINVAYRYQRSAVLPAVYLIPTPAGPTSGVGFESESLNQAEVSGAWPIARNWSVLGRLVYDLDVHQGLDRLLGFEYQACCWRVRVLARRYLINGSGFGAHTGQQDTAFLFQLQLNGLAGVGPATDAFLGTAIRGYSPTVSSR